MSNNNCIWRGIKKKPEQLKLKEITFRRIWNCERNSGEGSFRLHRQTNMEKKEDVDRDAGLKNKAQWRRCGAEVFTWIMI